MHRFLLCRTDVVVEIIVKITQALRNRQSMAGCFGRGDGRQIGDATITSRSELRLKRRCADAWTGSPGSKDER